jgi:hypothetical protein
MQMKQDLDMLKAEFRELLIEVNFLLGRNNPSRKNTRN